MLVCFFGLAALLPNFPFRPIPPKHVGPPSLPSPVLLFYNNFLPLPPHQTAVDMKSGSAEAQQSPIGGRAPPSPAFYSQAVRFLQAAPGLSIRLLEILPQCEKAKTTNNFYRCDKMSTIRGQLTTGVESDAAIGHIGDI